MPGLLLALGTHSRDAAVKFKAESAALRYPNTGIAAGCCVWAVAGHHGAAPRDEVAPPARGGGPFPARPLVVRIWASQSQ
jgi:hypothetical protein